VTTNLNFFDVRRSSLGTYLRRKVPCRLVPKVW
jgi:hypothetical protein